MGFGQIAGEAHHEHPADDLENLVGELLEPAYHGVTPILVSEFIDELCHAFSNAPRARVKN